MNRKNNGFTLIELMVVVAILGILAAIAYPSYQNSVLKSRRSDAKAALAEGAARQERIFVQTGGYSNDVSKLVTSTSGNKSPEGYYTMSVSATCSRTVNSTTLYSCYTLTATAAGPQASDTQCATLSIAQTGAKTSTGGGVCW